MKREASDPEEVIYCLVPGELAGSLHEPLREHFRDNPGVEVVVERRNGERRRARGGTNGAAPGAAERGQASGGADRRVAERRVPVAAAEPPALPRKARRHVERLRFLRRELPSGQPALDLEADRLVASAKKGDQDAFSELYERFYDMVYSSAKAVLADHHEAEDVAQNVFLEALRALPGFEIRPGQPFRAWLLVIARHAAYRTIERRDRFTVEDPEVIERRLERAGRRVEPQLEWLSTQGARQLLDRLPEDQRRVVAMRFLLGFSAEEIANTLDRTKQAVYDLQRRALDALQGSLAAGRDLSEVRSHRTPIIVRVRRATVLRERRWALDGSLGQSAAFARPPRFEARSAGASRSQGWRG